MEQQNGHAPDHGSDLKGKDPDATDFANYFCTYAFLFHQVTARQRPHSRQRLGMLPVADLTA